MFFRKLKEENKHLEKKVRKLEVELAEAKMIESEMRKLLADKHTEHCHADVVEAVRIAIIRKCGQVKADEPIGGLSWLSNTEPHAAEILALVTAYNELMQSAITGDDSDG